MSPELDADLYQQGDWLHVSLAPKNKRVLALLRIDNVAFVDFARQKETGWEMMDSFPVHEPSYWMPVPEIPSESDCESET